jgi:4-hydroxy-tetrahydrodipicolinate reductase
MIRADPSARPAGDGDEFRVALLGVGRVGRDLTRVLQARNEIRIVSAWSRDPAHHGADLGVLAGCDAPSSVLVTGDRDEALGAGADIAVVATTSFLRELAPDLEAAISSGHNVICTGEETAYPWAVDRELAARIDSLARANGVTIIGSGANPGFISDTLVVTLALAAPDVAGIRISRVVDVSRFSATVLGRLGVGYTAEEFAAGRGAGRIWGHIGYPQSMRLVADALGLDLERVDGTVEPLFAERPFRGDHLEVAEGRTAGFVQHYVGVLTGGETFDARMTGHLDPVAAGIDVEDTIEIDGSVPLRVKVSPGFRAQETSVAVLANSIARVCAASSGWMTVTELAPSVPRRNGGGS